MALLASLGIKKSKMLDIMNETDGEWLNLTIDVADTADTYGNNVKTYLQQTKEEREAKTEKKYIGNGRVYWTDGSAKAAPKK